MLNKVPEVTAYFWIIKILCTTVGESFADYINETLGFGLTNTTVLFSAALAVTLVFFVMFFSTYQGVRDADRVLIDNVRMLGASERQLVRHVLIPSALTWIFSSLQTSLGFAMVGAVVGEYLGSTRGLGYVISQAEGTFDTTGVFAGMTVLGIVVLMVSEIGRAHV